MLQQQYSLGDGDGDGDLQRPDDGIHRVLLWTPKRNSNALENKRQERGRIQWTPANLYQAASVPESSLEIEALPPRRHTTPRLPLG